MTGITPPVFTFSGMKVLVPPYIFRPTTRFAYCTATLRCPRSMNTTPPMIRIIAITRNSIRISPIWPVRSWSIVFRTPAGKFTTIPAKMISDMPLPIPRSVICSPNHMMKQVPVVRVSSTMALNAQPGLSTSGNPPEMSV